MINRITHVSVYVIDLDKAKAFYVDKLGMELRHDDTMEGFRWLTVGPADQPDLEIVLMPSAPSPMLDEDASASLQSLIRKGAFGCGVLATSDCEKAYLELKERGVDFVSPPAKRPWGLEAVLKDDSGNWYSLSQR